MVAGKTYSHFVHFCSKVDILATQLFLWTPLKKKSINRNYVKVLLQLPFKQYIKFWTNYPCWGLYSVAWYKILGLWSTEYDIILVSSYGSMYRNKCVAQTLLTLGVTVPIDHDNWLRRKPNNCDINGIVRWMM